MSFLSYPFLKLAFLAALFAGNAIALIGAFVVVRRVSFSGLAVSQLAGLGVVVALLGTHGSGLAMALALVFFGLVLLGRLERDKKIPTEAWVGGLYVLGASLSVLILSKAPLGEAHTLTLFFGNVLGLNEIEVWESVGLFVVVLVVLGGWFHRWMWIAFDPQAAQIAGINLRFWNKVFYGLLALAMTLAIHFFGVLLAFSYLLLPASIALLLSNRISTLFILIPVITTGMTLAGFAGSFHFDMPTGPLIAAGLGFLLLVGYGVRLLGKR